MTMHVSDPMAEERLKYLTAWDYEGYDEFSPGLEAVDRFMEICQPKAADTVIDIGCGRGKAGVELIKHNLVVTFMDLIDVRCPEAFGKRFIADSVSGNWPNMNHYGWDYGFCCDVMEHIPTEFVMLALYNIVRSCRVNFLSIALLPDQFGPLMGLQLHLTVRPFDWWRDMIDWTAKQNGKRLVDARDLYERGLYVVRR